MTIHIVPLSMLIVYAVLTIGVANIVLRKKLGAEHFLVAARALPLSLVIAVLLGDMVGGASTVGVCQRGYNEGLVSSLYSISLGAAFFAFAFTMSRRFRRLRAITIPEVTGRLFDAKTRLVSAFVIAVSYFFIGITQIMAGGALLSPLLGIDIWLAQFIAALLFVVIISAGGLHSIALVNIIQVFFIFAGLLIGLGFSLKIIGGSIPAGFSRITNELPSSFMSFSSRPLPTMTGEVLGTVFTFFAAQAAITGVFAAKDPKVAVQGTWIAGFLIMPIGVAFAMLGMCARVYFGESLPYGLSAAPAMMLELNPVAAGISLCGLFAAIISTGPLNFLAPIQIFIRDIYSVYIEPEASDRKLIILNRILAVVILGCGWALAVTFQEILKLTYWAFAFRAGIAVVLLSVTYLGSRYVSEDGAFWGLLSGVLVFAVWTLAGNPFGVHVAIPSMATVFAATLLISRFRKRRNEFAQEVQEALHPGTSD